jgi:hypothetical protein
MNDVKEEIMRNDVGQRLAEGDVSNTNKEMEPQFA